MRRLILILSGLLLTAGMVFGGNKTEGNCGKGVKWKLDEATGVLTIYGNGNMNDYNYYPDKKHSPWFRNQSIKKVVVEEGVTGIGKLAFVYSSVESVSLSSTVQEVRYRAFGQCYKLDSFEVSPDNPNLCSFDGALYDKEKLMILVYPPAKKDAIYALPPSVFYIEPNAFYWNSHIRQLVLSSSVAGLDPNTFKYCEESLKEIYYPAGFDISKFETKAKFISYTGSTYQSYYENFRREHGLDSGQTTPDKPSQTSKPRIKSGDAMKVAILAPIDKENKVSYAPKLMLRSYLTKAVTESEGYVGFDRVDLESIMSEQAFQRTGMVSDDQIKKLGEMTGAQYILMSEAVMVDDNTMYITAKLIDVESARTEKVDYQLMGSSPEAIQKGCVAMAENLLK